MTISCIYPDGCDVRAHVFEPLAGAVRDGRPVAAGAADAQSENAEETAVSRVREEAFARGMEAGKEAAQQELMRVAEVLAGAAEQFKRELADLRERLKCQMLDLSVAIARRVVMSELRTRPELIGEIVKRLRDEAEGRRILTLRVHPEDAKRLDSLPAGRALKQGGISVTEDDSITPGGCEVETGFGRLDARVETRLAEVAGGLLGMEAAPDEPDRATEEDVSEDGGSAEGAL